MKTYVYSLCKDRHPAPVRESIFDHEVSFDMGVKGLEELAEKRIPDDCGRLAIYCSGCTLAMMAVVAVCFKRGITLTAYHLNISKGGYERQEDLKF